MRTEHTREHPSTLALEIAAIDDAKGNLSQNLPDVALARLDAYRREFPHGALATEADGLRIEALIASGHIAKARTEFDVFRARHPSSPILDNVARSVGE